MAETLAPEKDLLDEIHIVGPELWVVWIDTNLGDGSPDWWQNSYAKPKLEAEEEYKDALARKFPACLLPEGELPKDGRLDWETIPNYG